MIRFGDFPGVLPVFPLAGALLLPRARLPLHIFEPRYLAMIDDVLKTPHRLMGLVQPRDGNCCGAGSKAALQCIGCAGRITGFSETEDGRYMITLTGISRFRVTRAVEGFAPYIRCDVSWAGFERDKGDCETDSGFDRKAFLKLLSRYFDAEGLHTDWEDLYQADDELLINSLSMLSPFEAEEKQALLEAPCLATRRETLVTLIEYALRRDQAEGPPMQ